MHVCTCVWYISSVSLWVWWVWLCYMSLLMEECMWYVCVCLCLWHVCYQGAYMWCIFMYVVSLCSVCVCSVGGSIEKSHSCSLSKFCQEVWNRRPILIPRVGHWMRLCCSFCLFPQPWPLPQPESLPSWEAQLNASLDLCNKALSIPSTVLSPSLNSVTPHCSQCPLWLHSAPILCDMPLFCISLCASKSHTSVWKGLICTRGVLWSWGSCHLGVWASLRLWSPWRSFCSLALVPSARLTERLLVSRQF